MFLSLSVHVRNPFFLILFCNTRRWSSVTLTEVVRLSWQACVSLPVHALCHPVCCVCVCTVAFVRRSLCIRVKVCSSSWSMKRRSCVVPSSLINEPRAAEHIALLPPPVKRFHRHTLPASLRSVKLPWCDESHIESCPCWSEVDWTLILFKERCLNFTWTPLLK